MSFADIKLYLISWFNQYPTKTLFFVHKAIHVLGGFFVALVIYQLVTHVFDPSNGAIAGLLAAGAVAIGKEVYDDIETKGPYQESFSSNVIDIIVTVLGGVLGVIAGLLCSIL